MGPREMLRVLGSPEKPEAATQPPGNPCKTCCPRVWCFSIQHVLVALFMQDSLGGQL